MTVRGFTTTTIEPDGTRHIRWFPEPCEARAERLESARDAAARGIANSAAGKTSLGKKLHAAACGLGTLYRFDAYHWQVRKDGAVRLDFWPRRGGRVSWRWNDSGMRKGVTNDFLAALQRGSDKDNRD